MKILRLVPADPSHRDWALSVFRGVVTVRAESEERARQLATAAFGQMARLIPGEDACTNPWRQVDRVTCLETVDDGYPAEGEEEILIPGVPAFEYREFNA